MTASLRIGLDIGGTFTDFVLADPRTGRLRLHKRLTTPEDPATGALDGRSSIGAVRGAASRPSSPPRWSEWTGSTSDACWS